MSFILAEGTYTSYTVYDSFDDTEIGDPTCSSAAWINCLETKAILITCSTTDNLKVYDIDTKTKGASTLLSPYDLYTSSTLGWCFKQTFLNTYVAFFENTTYNLLIYKNGVLLQTLTPTDLGLKSMGYNSVSFSPRGKYIIITGTRIASSLKGWVVLKGT